MADSDDEPLRAAFDRLDARKKAARKAEQDRKWEEDQILKGPMSPAEIRENARTARELRSQERIIKGIERLRDRDIQTYYERGFDKVYAHLTSTD
jgi:hypothetical protein